MSKKLKPSGSTNPAAMRSGVLDVLQAASPRWLNIELLKKEVQLLVHALDVGESDVRAAITWHMTRGNIVRRKDDLREEEQWKLADSQ